MSRSRLAVLAAAAALSIAALALDASGRWVGSVSGPDGNTFELIFNFAVDGQTLTGGISTPQGDLPISDGKVWGDSLSFVLSFGEFTVNHKGAVKGDTMTLTSDMGGQANAFVLTRAKAE